MSLPPQSEQDSFLNAAAVMEPTATAPLTRSARKRQQAAKKELKTQIAEREGKEPGDEADVLKSSWIGLGFSLAVHGFLLAILAVLVVHGAGLSNESDVVIDGNVGGGGGNAGLGDPVSIDLAPLLPAAGANAAPAMTTIDAIAIGSTRGSPLGTPGGAAETGLGGGSGSGFGGGDGDGFFKLPRGAVTAGSFAAWTVPQGVDNLNRKIRERGGRPGEPGESPLEGEVYFIVIRIKLPANRSTYSLSDLTGSVRGTDKYRQDIPQGVFTMGLRGRLEQPSPTAELPIRNRTVDIVMRVPGAESLVKDTIELKSKLLKESQTLTLQFGKDR